MTDDGTHPLDRPVLFFGGKGGVGKTTLAAAWALRSAERGRRTLLVSTDPAHSVGDLLERPLGDEPTTVARGLDALEIDPALEAQRYIAGVRERIREVTPPRLVEEVERQIEIARVTPGAEEAALFDRFAALMAFAGAEYDRVIFDTAPTGHTLRLLSLPELLSGWIEGLVDRRRKAGVVRRMWRTVSGAADEPAASDPVLLTLEARRDRFRRARTTVTDPSRAGFVLVTTAERLPVLETERTVRALGEYGIPIAGAVINQVLEDSLEGSYARWKRADQAVHLDTLVRILRHLPVVRIPWKHDADTMDVLARLADALDGLGAR